MMLKTVGSGFVGTTKCPSTHYVAFSRGNTVFIPSGRKATSLRSANVNGDPCTAYYANESQNLPPGTFQQQHDDQPQSCVKQDFQIWIGVDRAKQNQG